MSAKRKAVFGIVFSLLAISGYCFLRHYREQQWLAAKANEIVERAGAKTRREQVMALRDYLRRNVRYENALHDARPFLRDSARTTIESGRGYCGEATRAFINLAAPLGFEAQRVNLYGRVNHVVAEVEIDPGTSILVDPQENSSTNPYLDARDRSVDEVVGCTDSLFQDYSNIHLRRLPVISMIVQRVRMKNNWLTWTMENPWLILADCFLAASLMLIFAMLVDSILLRVYAYRLGIVCPSASPVVVEPVRLESSGHESALPVI